MKRPSRNQIIKSSVVVLVVAGIVAGWATTILSGRLDTSDPEAVAERFIDELQANHPNKAYSLTSPTYHKKISLKDFTDSVAHDISSQVPQSKVQPFSQATPPKNSGITGQMDFVFNIPRDQQHESHTIEILVVKEPTNQPRWYVHAFTFSVGTAQKAQ